MLPTGYCFLHFTLNLDLVFTILLCLHSYSNVPKYTSTFMYIWCLSCMQDLLYVISYGPSQVKPPAVQMLFHYWPNLKPPGAISEYRGLQYTGQILFMPHLLLYQTLDLSKVSPVNCFSYFSLFHFLVQPGIPSTVNILNATMPSINLLLRWLQSQKSLKLKYFMLLGCINR